MLVVNSISPELDQLAAALCEAGMLSTYVRPYLYAGRGWEKLLMRTPWVGAALESSLGRRRMPVGLDPARLRPALVMNDFLATAAGRLANKGSRSARALQSELLRRRAPGLARAGARAALQVDGVVGNYGVALPAFKVMQERQGISVLNYPITHHRLTTRVLTEEAERDPGFAGTEAPMNVHRATEALWDEECELADRVLLGSDFARRSFVDEGVPERKLHVVPYGADLDVFQPAPARNHKPDAALRVVFAGQASQRKGISYLLQAAARYDRQLDLTLVGSMPADRAPFRPYEKLFRFVPSLPRERLAELFRQHDVLVLPSLLEGLGMVVIEAMACGLPVIVTPTGPDQVVDDGCEGFVVPVRDPDALCDRLARLHDDADLRRRMGERALARARGLGWAQYRKAASAVVTAGRFPPPSVEVGAA